MIELLFIGYIQNKEQAEPDIGVYRIFCFSGVKIIEQSQGTSCQSSRDGITWSNAHGLIH